MSHLDLASHHLPSLGFNLTSSIVLSMLTSKTQNHLFFNFFTVFLKDQSLHGPLLFILYTTPLSTVISNSSANHHLYADDTQLPLSFSAADFSYNITHLENTISNVYKLYNWMSSNFLFLNPSKTEFFITGLPQQLSKLRSPTIHLPNDITLTPSGVGTYLPGTA